ncbi:MAG: pyridoxamine 5'-phosphate oxidase family protein, partial [Roseinatronobacter sp.]
QSLRALFPAVHALAKLKSLDTLDDHAQAFIRRTPFICIGTQNADGTADVSPRGDPRGFVAILDNRTLAIPDRPGNNRLDTLSNLIANPSIGLLFMIPGFDDTLRVNGRARLVTDPQLLERLAVNERAPCLAIVVDVAEVFLHCAKAFRRSKLWDPAQFQDRSDMPSLMKMLLDQTGDTPTDNTTLNKMDEQLEEAYKSSMY